MAAAALPLLAIIVVAGARGSLIDALLTFGIAAVGPLAMRLDSRRSGVPGRQAWVIATCAAGSLGGVALLVRPGALAVVLGLPWLTAGVIHGVRLLPDAYRRAQQRRRLARLLLVLIARAYLVVSGGWLALYLGGASPSGFAPQIVELTAVHFLFTGFVTSVLAGEAWNAAGVTRWSSVSAAAATLIATGPPLVAAGFLGAGVLLAVGALALTAGVLLIATITVVTLPRERVARRLLLVSVALVPVSMTLAALYGLALAGEGTAPSVTMMASTHGVINAVGFCACGTLGRLLSAAPAP